MPFPYDLYPWINFQELNLSYFIAHFREIFQQWDSLYETMTAWQASTDEELEEWKTTVETGISSWETGFTTSMETWKSQTATDISGWETATLAALDAWKAAFQTLFDETFSDISTIKTDAEAARDAAALSASGASASALAAEASAVEAAAAAAEIADHLAAIAENRQGLQDNFIASSESGYVDLTSEDYTLLDYSYIDEHGAIAHIDTQNYYVFKIPCVPGDKFQLTARAYTGRYYYCWVNSSDALISGLLATEPSMSAMPLTEITAPEGAAQLWQASRPASGYTRITRKWETLPTSYTTDTTLTLDKAANAAAVGARLETIEDASNSHAGRITALENKFVTGTAYTKKWSGLKWVVFGDSLTEENAKTTKHYFDYVSEVTGIEIYNMGDSGSGYMNENDLGTAFYQRIGDVPTDADVITIFGSFNDNHYYSVMGTAGDSGTATIGGCIRQTFSNLFAAFPLAVLGVVTPCPWSGQNPINATADASVYCQLIIDSCRMYSIPCMDLFHDSNLRPWNATFRQLAYSKDGGGGTHPDETGHAILAPKFEAFLDRLLLH